MKPITIILVTGIALLSACVGDERKTSPINESASLPASFKFSNAGLKLVTSFINKKSGSMSVLYTRNDTRILITWQQKSDENWFGANVPGKLLSVEEVESSRTTSYKEYNDQGLIMADDTTRQKERIRYILDQQASMIP